MSSLFTKRLSTQIWACNRLLKSQSSLASLASTNRFLKTSTTDQSEHEKKTWLSKFMTVRNIEPGKDAHSKLLSDPEAVYELQIHDVKPGYLDQYLVNCERLVNELQQKEKQCELVGSFKVEVGDQDQVVNIWRYNTGYSTAGRVHQLLRSDSQLNSLVRDESKLLRKRENQVMVAFSFWGHAQPAVRNCNYEMRSYVLKPGTMIEWGNNWAKGINYRQNKVAGFFSQIGQLYMVHHIWHYDDFQNRKDVRENAWRKPGWDEVVAYTVPLIREMRSRWLVGNSFSPIK